MVKAADRTYEAGRRGIMPGLAGSDKRPALTLDLVVLAVGEDKSADQADTIGTVRRLHE